MFTDPTGTPSKLSRLSTDFPRILVGIASYGTKQDHFLKQVVAAFEALPNPTRIVVLTNAPKQVQGCEIRVGLPSRDPYSLPFAHKQLFAENLEDYDLFIYTEDDTLITGEHIASFLDAQASLREDEIAGFVRFEENPEGRRFITSINTLFRWLPNSVVERGGELYANLTNEHSGCFLVTQSQLRRAIDSGGFGVPPHAEVYGMLETAASDLYTQCGLRRLISISRTEDFMVAHLANKYHGTMGLPSRDLDVQLGALRELSSRGGWTGELYEPGSGAPGHRWSKNLYEQPDPAILDAIPPAAARVLSIGCGWGATEAELRNRGKDVCAVPIDVVLASSVRQRGLRVELGPFDEVIERLDGERFDAILFQGCLQLVDAPIEWLAAVADLLAPGARVVASLPNTTEFSVRVQDWMAGRKGATLDARASGLQEVSASRLRAWCREAGLKPVLVRAFAAPSRGKARRLAAQLTSHFATDFLLVAERAESN